MGELFRNVLNASVQGSIVIAIVLVLRLLLCRVPRRYICLLWILAGIRLLTPFTPESSFSLQPPEPPISQVQWADLVEHGEVIEELAPVETVHVSPEQGIQAAPSVPVEREPEFHWAQALPWLWLAGMGGLLLYCAVSYALLKGRVREAVRISGNVWECPGLSTAFLLGFFPARIYLPRNLTDESRELILAHERTHLRRLDHLTRLVGFLTAAVHWFNPLVWLGYLLLCRDMELACDEAVIRDMDLPQRKAYSAALLECSAPRDRYTPCPVAFGEISVKRRIVSVLRYRKAAVWSTVLAVLALIFVAVCFLTQPKSEPPAAPGDSESWEAQCRDALSDLQERDYYYIQEIREFQDLSIRRDAYKDGDDWLRVEQNLAEDNCAAYLSIGGRTFEAQGEQLDFSWDSVDFTEDAIFDPWLYTFDPDAQDVNASAYWTDDSNYYIRLMVNGPYDGGYLYAENYYVDFAFDEKDRFTHAVLHATEGEEKLTVTMYAPDLSHHDVAITIKAHESNTDNTQWVRLHAADVTPSGMTLLCEQSITLFPGMLTTGRDYWLEYWTLGTGWQILKPIADPIWPMDARTIPFGTTSRFHINWQWLYGELEPGTYRIGKGISYEPTQQIGVSLPACPVATGHHCFYAWFQIPEDTGEFLP